MASKVELMRDSLMLAIEQVKTGALSPEKAKAMAALAHQVNASLDVELKVLIAATATPAISRLAAEQQVTRQIASGTVHKANGVTQHRIGDEP